METFSVFVDVSAKVLTSASFGITMRLICKKEDREYQVTCVSCGALYAYKLEDVIIIPYSKQIIIQQKRKPDIIKLECGWNQFTKCPVCDTTNATIH